MERQLGAPDRELTHLRFFRDTSLSRNRISAAPQPRPPPVRKRVPQWGSRIGEGKFRDSAGLGISRLQTRPQPWDLTTQVRIRGQRTPKQRARLNCKADSES